MNFEYLSEIQLRQKEQSCTLRADSGNTFEVSWTDTNRSINYWWEKQAQTELRVWQRDICVYYMSDVLGICDLSVIYKKGMGYTQPHDICLVRNRQHNVYCLSTARHFWISLPATTSPVFSIKDSVGSILDLECRQRIGQIFDQLKCQFNPDNLMMVRH